MKKQSSHSPVVPREVEISSPSESYAEVVYQRLREEVFSGVLQPGDRLREIEVAARMRTSQGPVREAFARLREQGFIISLPYRGSYVTEISIEEARDAYAVRAVLERLALQHALPRMGPEEFGELERDVAAMAEAAKEGRLADQIELDMQFHRRAYEWSGSSTLLQLWNVVEIKIRKFTIVATPPVFTDDPFRGVVSHYPLLERMREGYSLELEAELDRHLSLIWMTSGELEEANAS